MAAEHDQIPEAALGVVRRGQGAWRSRPSSRPGARRRGRPGRSSRSAPARRWWARSRAAASRARWWPRRWRRSADGRPRMLDYGVSDAEAFAVGLACGGRIRVMVEPVGVGQGLAAGAPRAAGRGAGGADARGLCGATRRAGSGGWSPGRGDPLWRGGARRRWRRTARGSRATGSSGCTIRRCAWRWSARCISRRRWCPMARIAGYDLAVIDPREAFASAARFPGTPLSHDWPDAALGRLRARRAARRWSR